MWAPSHAAFFYPRPVPTLPLLDALLIALHGAPLGLLAAEAQIMQKSGNMATVETDPERLVDDTGDPAGGPQLRLKAVRDRAAQQLPDKLTTLAVAECRWSTGRHAHLQTLLPVLRQRITPTHDRTGRTPSHAPGLSERITLVEQPQRLTAPRLNHFCRSLGSCHRWAPREVTESLLHYLRDSQ